MSDKVHIGCLPLSLFILLMWWLFIAGGCTLISEWTKARIAANNTTQTVHEVKK